MSAGLTEKLNKPLSANQSFWPALATLFFGSFVGMYHVVSLNVSLPGFIGIFQTDLGKVQWIVTGFSLACGVIAPASGYAGDRFGGKQVFLFCLSGITVTSVLCALSWNIYALIAFRILQGIFCGLIQPVSLAMIYRTVPPEKQPIAVSIWSFSTILGTALAPSVSGWLQGYDWHLIFLVTVPIGILALMIGIRILPSNPVNRETKLDRTGLALAALGSLSLLLLFGNIYAWGWRSAAFWICLIVGLGSAAWFVIHQLRTPAPLLQLRLFRNKTFTVSLIISLILSVALYSGIYFVPLYLSQIHHLSSFHIGLLFLPGAACLTCATFFSGRYYNKFGPAVLAIVGSTILILTTYMFSRLQLTTSLLTIMIIIAIRNTGTGLALTPVTNAGMMAIPKELSGHASALINWLRQVFSAMALGMFTSLFYARLAIHQARSSGTGSEPVEPHAYTMSINDAFLLSAVIIVAALPLALLLRKRRRTSSSSKQA
ncbi:DHA2 family efflux MFS transporter permease subunit [Bacillus sp. FJAT-26390]|uniref:DHA2 family efflux MFS transporter permease subunit n=1 Tax=Bacillus sp. FJAT-26390 TaxID=1743142 RepID=UPI000807C33B|nr:DHA2 family efflux MFS transporter permease subunit [Bacillus sp. FJAT-26390]OBZ11332.1 multidrug MFS transporter [Bacillus sp. FJAT-26390]